MYAPLSLNVTVTLIFDLETPNSIGVIMTNHRTKLEDPWAMSSLIIDQTRFVYGPKDRLTYQPTNQHVQSYVTPTSSKEGGIIIVSYMNEVHQGIHM